MRHIGTVPILRSFDAAKAREFYLGFLGMSLDWEHRFAPEAPLYMQVSRNGLVLHLSEHHGDATPGSHIRVEIEGVEALHRELLEKRYASNRPGLERPEWGGLEVTVTDPASNCITFFSR
ncbi:hypothetical protein SAMN02983003_2492 [Devosia enhydra]|uniref:Bleomycin resistance protein n=1 Tax=Devosia enhydra TaxID=665118 RepID=A0A1K2I0M4_9HYPH|nr:glyoxalase superfamily protein [Devosia enhydra]SFZ85291.1 hypothetical protein SAMN02983003_2492 [Devosia enhydra]